MLGEPRETKDKSSPVLLVQVCAAITTKGITQQDVAMKTEWLLPSFILFIKVSFFNELIFFKVRKKGVLNKELCKQNIISRRRFFILYFDAHRNSKVFRYVSRWNIPRQWLQLKEKIIFDLGTKTFYSRVSRVEGKTKPHGVSIPHKNILLF